MRYVAPVSREPEIVVIGAGPNGLAAACRLALAGLRVLVVEANPKRAGGALGSEEATLPGFVHDVGAAFFPFAAGSPAFRALPLSEHGLRWSHAPIDSAHPAPDGSLALLARDPERIRKSFGDPRDAETILKITRWYAEIEEDLLPAMLEPIPAIKPALRLLPFHALRLARIFLASGARLSRRLFRSPAAQRVLPGLALHTDVGPDDTFGSGIGFMLGMTATTGGYAIPCGGAQAITDALVSLLRANGGELRLGATVEKIVVSGGQASAIKLCDGEEIPAPKGILANCSAPSLFLDLLDAGHLPGRIVRSMRRFPMGWGTFKVDWALDEAVPWSDPRCKESAVVHAGDDLEDLSRFTKEVRSGSLPSNPYLVIGQQSLFDPSRAPDGKQTLWAYSRVPSRLGESWASAKERFADRVEERIEGLAPGFRNHILGRRVLSPDDLQTMDANLIGGDLGGGSNAWYRQLVFRPIFPYFRYQTPLRGLYLCSSYTHPGAGVHGMCGYNAAGIVLGRL